MKRSLRRARPGRDHHGAAPLSSAPLLERLRGYFFLHAHTLIASLGRLYSAPIGSGMTVLVIAIAMSLPASFQVLVKNAQRASGGLEATNEISIYLKPSLSNEVARKITEKLRDRPQITEAKLITKEAGLKEFREYSGFGEALQALDSNPCPPSSASVRGTR